MRKKLVIFLGLFILLNGLPNNAKNLFEKDEYEKNLKYQAEIKREKEKDKRDRRILNLFPTGYMTVEEYEALSEYKDKQSLEFNIPKVGTPSDFKYVPKPTYRIVKYNDPPGSVELSLGKNLYTQRLVNAQGIVAPDYSKLVYPAVYYYTDSASVAADLFVIPLNEGDTNLNKILKANVAKRDPDPILSTDKAIDNYATFRTLTPVDFSIEGSKLLVKEKIGSREDGIWLTNIHIYDFNTKLSYNLSEVRDAVVYFWKEYMGVNLDEKRWDIYPIGFDKKYTGRVIIQAFAFTGAKPVFLGTWSIDWLGNQSRLVSFDKNADPLVSVNGYKIVQDGVKPYVSEFRQNKIDQKEAKYVLKQRKIAQDEVVKQINDEYKQNIKEINDNYKDDYREYKALKKFQGTTENEKLKKAYEQYLIDQSKKEIKKLEQQIKKQKEIIKKHDKKMEKMYANFDKKSKTSSSSLKNSDLQENSDLIINEQNQNYTDTTDVKNTEYSVPLPIQ